MKNNLKIVIGVSTGMMIAAAAVAAPKTFNPPKKYFVKADVADVRSEMKPSKNIYKYDALQETQVEHGEPVLVYERDGNWMRVECPQQMEFTHKNEWQGYPGWIERKYLSENASLEKPITEPKELDKDLRWQILNEAKRHLGAPYFWGGRSLYNPKNKKVLTGVDCSGLVNWSYRQVGWLVPRDAHEQSMKARKLEPKNLKSADLIFLAKADNPEKIVHVALYGGNETLIEAPQTGEKVREISFMDRFGKSLSELSNGTVVGDRVVTFGTFFPEEQ